MLVIESLSRRNTVSLHLFLRLELFLGLHPVCLLNVRDEVGDAQVIIQFRLPPLLRTQLRPGIGHGQVLLLRARL